MGGQESLLKIDDFEHYENSTIDSNRYLDRNRLYQSIKEENVAEVYRLINGIDPNELNELLDETNTPLILASRNGFTGIVSLLLKAGSDPNIVNVNSVSPLWLASFFNYTKMTELLLLHKANPDIVNDHNHTPLYEAAFKGYKDLARLLILSGANPNIVDTDNRGPLYWASSNGDIEIVKLLLSVGANPNMLDENNTSILYAPSGKGHTEIVKFLLEAGANPNDINKYGNGPLNSASFHGHTEIVKLLLDAGVDSNIVDKDNKTPLYLASAEGHTKTVELLLSVGSDPNIIATYYKNPSMFYIDESKALDNERRSPLYEASAAGHVEIVQLLLSAGADPSIANKINKTPIDIALEKGHLNIVEILQNWEGLDPNKITEKGRNVLMDFIFLGYYPVFKRYLPRVITINHRDNNGNTALHYAILLQQRQMAIDLLEQPGIDLTLENKDHKTAFQCLFEVETDHTTPYFKLIKEKSEAQAHLKYLPEETEARLAMARFYKRKKSNFLRLDPKNLSDSDLVALTRIFALPFDEASRDQLVSAIRKAQLDMEAFLRENQGSSEEDYLRTLKRTDMLYVEDTMEL